MRHELISGRRLRGSTISVPRDASGKRSDRFSRAGEHEACRGAFGNDGEQFAMAERIHSTRGAKSKALIVLAVPARRLSAI